MTLLHLDSSILGAGSVSRKLSADVVAQLRASHPDVAIVYRDLAETPVPHLSGATLFAAQSPGAEHPQPVTADLALSSALMQEFLAADTVVIGVAFYNFSVPSQLKAWIDRILVSGQTFRYGAEGRPEGLCGGKRVILALARGGVYAPGSPIASFEHAETYLRAVFGFIGVTQVEVVAAEGLAMGPDQRAQALAAAERQVAAIAA